MRNPPIIPRLVSLLWLAAVSVATVARAAGVPHEVLAAYYGWYGKPGKDGVATHWNKVNADQHEISDSTHYPTLGAYDSRSPKIIAEHIQQAKAHGVTGFIVSWWGAGRFEERPIPTLLAEAEKTGFKISVYWERVPPKGSGQAEKAVEDLVYLATHFGTNSAFLKVDGKPVIFVYERVLADVPKASWPAILSQAHAKAGPFLLIADGYTDTNAQLFDGMHRYNIGWG